MALKAFFEREKAPFAVVGGMAVVALGFARNTFDLDIVTSQRMRSQVAELLRTRGFEVIFDTPAFSGHLRSTGLARRIDVMYVRGETEEKLFRMARPAEVFAGVDVPIPHPEHLIAMKAQAIRDDPARTFGDLTDIEFLIELPGVDFTEVRGYFERYGLGRIFDDIEKRHAAR